MESKIPAKGIAQVTRIQHRLHGPRLHAGQKPVPPHSAISEDVYGWHIAKADIFNLKHERHRPFLVHHQRVELVVYLLLYWID